MNTANLIVSDMAARRASHKVARRLIPFLTLCYIIAFLDRVNVGFAALTMNKELGLTAEMFGFGAGIFFFGYFIFEVPSNLILERIGARRWIARIMISWGVISASFAFVPSISTIFQSLGFPFFDNARTFYLMRFIFGAAEAGFFPGTFFISPIGSQLKREPVASACSIRRCRCLRSLEGRFQDLFLIRSTAPRASVDGSGCSLSKACHLFSLGYGL
jgi:hypothetical protein